MLERVSAKATAEASEGPSRDGPGYRTQGGRRTQKHGGGRARSGLRSRGIRRNRAGLEAREGGGPRLGPRRRGRAGAALAPDAEVGRPARGRTDGRTVQRAALTMSSMVLSSITESGSMAAPAAPPRSPRAAANGPGGGGDGGGGRGGGGYRTHSSCQPARAAGSSALPLGERSTQTEDYSSQQAPGGPQSVVGTSSQHQANLFWHPEAEF